MTRGASCTCDPRRSSSAERRSASAFVLLKEFDEYSSGYSPANGARGGGARGGRVAVVAGSTVATTWRLRVVPAEAGPVRRARCGRVLAIWRTTRDRCLARIGRRAPAGVAPYAAVSSTAVLPSVGSISLQGSTRWPAPLPASMEAWSPAARLAVVALVESPQAAKKPLATTVAAVGADGCAGGLFDEGGVAIMEQRRGGGGAAAVTRIMSARSTRCRSPGAVRIRHIGTRCGRGARGSGRHVSLRLSGALRWQVSATVASRCRLSSAKRAQPQLTTRSRCSTSTTSVTSAAFFLRRSKAPSHRFSWARGSPTLSRWVRRAPGTLFCSGTSFRIGWRRAGRYHRGLR